MAKLKKEQNSIFKSTCRSAMQSGGTSIHILVGKEDIDISMRRNKMLVPITDMTKEEQQVFFKAALILGGFNPNVKRAVQKRTSSLNPEVEKITRIPTLLGEYLIVELQTHCFLTLDELGLDAKSYTKIMSYCENPSGICIVTGPSESGKTTTIHAIASKIADNGKTVMAFEENPLCNINGVIQYRPSDDNHDMKTAFETACKSDIDTVVLENLNSRETFTSYIGGDSSVLTSMNVYTVFDVITRLEDMGLELNEIAKSISLVVAQRILPKKCQNCDKDRLNSEVVNSKNTDSVCEVCGGSVYVGVIPVFEVLEIDALIREAIMRDANKSEMSDIAKEQGMVSLGESLLKLQSDDVIDHRTIKSVIGVY